MVLENLTSDDFQSRLEEPFETSLGDLPVVLTLTAVEVADERFSRPSARLAFSLIFHGPLAPILPQDTYAMKNRALGELALFAVPLGPRAESQRYEVVFS